MLLQDGGSPDAYFEIDIHINVDRSTGDVLEAIAAIVVGFAGEFGFFHLAGK